MYLPLDHAAAAAREMLVVAAAAKWSVEPASCRAENGRVMHPASQRSLSYGELASAAARLPVPSSPALKPKVAIPTRGQGPAAVWTGRASWRARLSSPATCGGRG
jgi:CO/xanthine dehydrogenase Mo-binding subunit